MNLCDIFKLSRDLHVYVIYNGSKIDSFLAAFIVWRSKCLQHHEVNPKLEFFNAERGAVPSVLKQCQMLCLGFTYKRQTLDYLSSVMSNIVIADNYDFDSNGTNKHVKIESKSRSNVSYVDLDNHSSSYVVWSALYPETPAPLLVEYVQDRELFSFKLKNTREVISYISSYPLDFGIWNELFSENIETIIRDGSVIRRYNAEICKNTVKGAYRVNFMGYNNVPVLNCPRFLMSEALSYMIHNNPIVIGYYDKLNKRHFSLRSSSKSNIDVLKIAQKFGGGGHKTASGFTVDLKSSFIDSLVLLDSD